MIHPIKDIIPGLTHKAFATKRLVLLVMFFLLVSQMKAQSAKELYKLGLEAQKKSNYTEAVKNYTAAINLKPNYNEAYFERANANFILKQFDEALKDYLSLHRSTPLNESYIYRAALTYMELKRWADAQSMLMKLEADDMNLHVAEAKIKMAQCKIMLKNFEEAVSYLSESTSMFVDDDQIYFYKGIASDSLKDYQSAAICYSKSIEINEQKLVKKKISIPLHDSLKIIYLSNLGNTQMSLFDFVGAKESYSVAISLNKKNSALYLKRAIICLQNNELNEALADLKICESLNLKSYIFYYTQARVLKKAGQFNQAIESLDIIATPDTAYHAQMLKGQCYESIGKFEEAQTAYKAASLSASKEKIKETDAALKRIRNRIYEMNRESNQPIFSISSPALDIDNKIMIPKSYQYVEIKGKVQDKSLIKSIFVNEQEATFDRDSLNPSFRIKVNVADKENIKFRIIDIYSNTTEQSFEFNRNEKNKPGHKLFLAYSASKAEIYADKLKEKNILITGRVEDESAIKRIMINNKIASFNLSESNPIFEANIDISHTDSINILIIDEYDNVSTTSYYINSSKALEMKQNPMGKTWLVFIANSNYENYSTLSGPVKDHTMVRDALLNYKFDNIISKQNMTLTEMEKFFRIELRDLVKEQGVNSLLIWFAGHGKYINETGYWLPVNAKKEEEVSLYPIPYLRSNINSYGKILRNILIVSDACESGPAFSLTDGIAGNFSCNNLQSNQQNSSAYVFSSTSNEKASDNSVFCETFVDLLNSNPNQCIAMSEVVKVVSSVVEKRQSQRCKYGKIKEINNNTGNFYFIKRDN